MNDDSAALELAESFIKEWEHPDEPDSDFYTYRQLDNDPDGTYTVGWGHTTRNKKLLGKQVDTTFVQEAFSSDLRQAHADAIQFAGTKWRKLSSNQKAALISTAFNSGNLVKKAPKAYKHLQDDNISGALHELYDPTVGVVKGTKDGKKVPLLGLQRRRQSERFLFLNEGLPSRDTMLLYRDKWEPPSQ